MWFSDCDGERMSVLSWLFGASLSNNEFLECFCRDNNKGMPIGYDVEVPFNVGIRFFLNNHVSYIRDLVNKYHLISAL